MNDTNDHEFLCFWISHLQRDKEPNAQNQMQRMALNFTFTHQIQIHDKLGGRRKQGAIFNSFVYASSIL